MRVIFECGLFSSADWILFFFFFWPETNAYSSIKKSLSWWFHFQQLSEFQNILNLCPKIQIHQQMQWISAKFTKSFRIIIECGLKSSAGWIFFFFLFFWLEKNVYSSIKKSSSWWSSATINWLSAVVRVSKYSKSLSQNSATLANASSAFSSLEAFDKSHHSNQLFLLIFFFSVFLTSLKVVWILNVASHYYLCQTLSECKIKIHETFADYFQVRIKFECGLNFFFLKNCGLNSSAD